MIIFAHPIQYIRIRVRELQSRWPLWRVTSESLANRKLIDSVAQFLACRQNRELIGSVTALSLRIYAA